MIDPRKYKYLVIIMASDKKQYDITEFVENVTWEEPEKEIAARITFAVKDDKTAKGRISYIAKPGCWVCLLYSYSSGKNVEAVRGRIVEWNPSAGNNKRIFRIKAYDILYDLQESQDNVYFPSGTKTQSAIRQILNRWNIPIGIYTGPDVSHKKMAYKSEKLGSMIIKILQEAKKKGGKDAVLRSVKNTVNVLEYGSNTTTFVFTEGTQMTQMDHKITTVGMVTRVKIIGKEDDDGNVPVEAVVDGDTSYGIRQKIESRPKDTSLEDAKNSAQETIDEEGKPKETITVTVPDMPVLRKGDGIFLKATTMKNTYYYCLSVTHNIDKGTMTLSVKKASDFKDKDTGKKITKPKKKEKKYAVGDIVKYNGGTFYASSGKKAKGTKAGSGKAKITKIKNGAAHPYRLATQNWAKTKVNGWVDSGTFS